jgi:integrase
MKGKITKRGDSWTMMIDLPPHPVTGKRRQRRITADTKKEVEALATKALASIESGGFAEADAKKITVSEYMARWLESIRQSMRPASYRRYADLSRQHIEPVIGRIHLAKLSQLDVQSLYADRIEYGLSPTSVGLLHCILHRALKQAMRGGLLTRNVTELVDVPRRITPEYVTWDREQATSFLAVSDKDDLAALWRLALLTGMRRGEILGLKWDDLDLARGALSVKRTISRGNGGSFEFGPPKSGKGRQIALPRSATDALHKHRVKQLEKRMPVGISYNDLGLIFADALGEPLHPNTLRLRFLRLMKEAGVPVLRIHDLRHTSATLMLANGENPKIVSERLGHANIGITMDRYSHVTATMQRESADRLDTLLGG